MKLIPEYYRKSRERKGPAALLVGLETSVMSGTMKPEES